MAKRHSFRFAGVTTVMFLVLAANGAEGPCSRESWGDKDGRAKVDFNRDGYLDYCRVEGPAANGSVCCTLSEPGPASKAHAGAKRSGVATYVWGYMKGPHIKVEGVQLGEPQGRAWVDVNGDGYPDFCRVVPKADGGVALSCLLNDHGKGFRGEMQQKDKLGAHDVNTRAWVDIAGDGKADFCRMEPNDIVACNMAATGFATVIRDVVLPGEKSK
jgi:hypothetical protein